MSKPKPVLFIAALFLSVLISCTKDKLVENKVPISNAGPSRTLALPTDTITLKGSGSDTDGHVVAYLWSQVSGPVASSIVNPGSPATLVKVFAAGTYVFQLMVTDDKGATGVDTASLVVKAPEPQTVTISPASNPYEVQLANYNGADQSGVGGGRYDIPIEAWTKNSLPLTVREILKFDLSGIPANATITAANLYLYSSPNPALNGNLVDANFGTDNSFILQQVTSSWSTSTIGWFNQPVTSTGNQIILPSTTQSVLDLNIDVTSMVGSMVNNNANYGFLLKLQSEVTYTSRQFVSSYTIAYPTKRPKLVVTYH